MRSTYGLGPIRAAFLTVLFAYPATASPWLVDRTAESGLAFEHRSGGTGAFYMPENMGAGGALLDVDNDGDLDLLLLQGGPLGPGKALANEAGGDRLFRNEGRGENGVPRFVDITADSGLGPGGYSMGVATGDVDSDGNTDLYITRLGGNQLLRGLGNGRFEDITAAAGADDSAWSVAAVFFDYDGDGALDLYVGNYVAWSYAANRACVSKAGARDYCHPSVYEPVPDRLLHNLGKGAGGSVRFEDVTRKAGLASVYGRALGAAAADFDGDGLIDLYVANDGSENQLWHNQRDGTFADVALLAGCAVSEAGLAQASMGVVAEDLDGDGDLDLLLSHVNGESHTFYRGDGKGNFDDATARSGLGTATLDMTGFGLGAADFDGDGILDLFSASGAVAILESLAQAGDPYPYGQRNQLFRGLGGGRFEQLKDAGEALAPIEVSRGVILGDVDNDGDTDVVLTSNQGRARLLLGTLSENAHQKDAFVGARVLLGFAGKERDALGARVGLASELAGWRSDLRWQRVASDGSYASAKDMRVLFRLRGEGKEREIVRELRVVWPDGEVEVWPSPAAGVYHSLRRGEGRKAENPAKGGA